MGRLNAHRLETLATTEEILRLSMSGNGARAPRPTEDLLAPKPGSTRTPPRSMPGRTRTASRAPDA